MTEHPVVEPETTEQAEQTEKTAAVKKGRPRRKHKKKNYLLRLVIVLVLLCAAFACAHLSYFDVAGIAVIGNEEVTDVEIIKLSEVKTGGSVFDVHPLLVQHKIKKNLYQVRNTKEL